jgi:hypothetical protein
LNKKKIAACFSLILIAVTVVSTLDYWIFLPEPEIKIEIESKIEQIADSKGISTLRVTDLKSEFVESVSFGGAGGMGAAKIVAGTADEFINITEYMNCDKILVAFESTDIGDSYGKVLQRYWGVGNNSGSLIIEYEREYSMGSRSGDYVFVGIEGSNVVFAKNYVLCFISAAIITAFVLIVVAYVVSCILKHHSPK